MSGWEIDFKCAAHIWCECGAEKWLFNMEFEGECRETCGCGKQYIIEPPAVRQISLVEEYEQE